MVDKVNQAMEVPKIYTELFTPTGCLVMFLGLVSGVLIRLWMDRWK